VAGDGWIFDACVPPSTFASETSLPSVACTAALAPVSKRGMLISLTPCGRGSRPSAAVSDASARAAVLKRSPRNPGPRKLTAPGSPLDTSPSSTPTSASATPTVARRLRTSTRSPALAMGDSTPGIAS
jgi:hypothetical protein